MKIIRQKAFSINTEELKNAGAAGLIGAMGGFVAGNAVDRLRARVAARKIAEGRYESDLQDDELWAKKYRDNIRRLKENKLPVNNIFNEDEFAGEDDLSPYYDTLEDYEDHGLRNTEQEREGLINYFDRLAKERENRIAYYRNNKNQAMRNVTEQAAIGLEGDKGKGVGTAIGLGLGLGAYKLGKKYLLKK